MNSLGHENILKIARSSSVKELTVPLELIPKVLSDTYSIEKLTILGSRRTIAGLE